MIETVTVAEARQMIDSETRGVHSAARRKLLACLELFAPETPAEKARLSIITNAVYEDQPPDEIRSRLSAAGLLIPTSSGPKAIVASPAVKSAVDDIYARRAKACEAAR